LNGKPNKYAELSARLTDVLGSPVVGRSVGFMLGARSISATTDGAGLALANLKLLQKPDLYSPSASFAGDSHYEASSVDPSTFIIGSGGCANNGVGGGPGGPP
jgi:hypothetical protein